MILPQKNLSSGVPLPPLIPRQSIHPLDLYPHGPCIPKSSILIGFSIINQPFWATPTAMETPIFIPMNILSQDTSHCSGCRDPWPHTRREGSIDSRILWAFHVPFFMGCILSTGYNV